MTRNDPEHDQPGGTGPSDVESVDASESRFGTDVDARIESIPLVEELLEARVVSKQIGSVLIHKHVESQTVSSDIELHREDVIIEQVVKDEFVDEKREPWYEDDTLVIPLYEEVLVSQRKLMLTKLIRVQRTARIEHTTVEGEVRREVLDIEPRPTEG